MALSNWEKLLHRRRFMNSMLGAAAAAAMAPAALARAGEKEEEQEQDYRSLPYPPTREYPDMPPAVVAARGIGGSIEDAVREAVMAAGGLAEIEPGQTVMIKPNMCGPAILEKFPGRITTNPEVIRAVIRLCRERGASKIYVGDRAMFWTETAIKTAGFARVCKEEGAVALPWTRVEYKRFYPGKRHWSTGFRYPAILDEVDHFINVPLLKHHAIAGAQFTCCLKSFVGVCHPEDRHLGGKDELHDLNIGEKIAELNLCARPVINIVDATEILVSGGPDGLSHKRSKWCPANLILASRDRVACDSLALAVLKLYAAETNADVGYVNTSVWDQPQIYYSAEIGIGQAEPGKVTIEDVKVPRMDEIRANWA